MKLLVYERTKVDTEIFFESSGPTIGNKTLRDRDLMRCEKSLSIVREARSTFAQVISVEGRGGVRSRRQSAA